MQTQGTQQLDMVLTAIVKLSKTALNYWAEFAVDIPFGIVLICLGLRSGEYGPLGAVVVILFGLLLFSIIEYAFHRWLFHGPVRIIAQGHWAHHANPLGYDSLPFFLPALILLGLAGVFILFMPAEYTCLLTGTIALSYVIYGLSHFTIHHHLFHNVFARNWAAHHHIHHHHPDTNFGVTTPLWDKVLGTGYKRTGRHTT